MRGEGLKDDFEGPDLNKQVACWGQWDGGGPIWRIQEFSLFKCVVPVDLQGERSTEQLEKILQERWLRPASLPPTVPQRPWVNYPPTATAVLSALSSLSHGTATSYTRAWGISKLHCPLKLN